MANIFIIDDEPVLLELISKTLRLDGHKVLAFCGPSSFFDTSPAAQSAMDLLLTDVDMKPMTGFEVAKRLNQNGFTGKVLFMSGYVPFLADDLNLDLNSVIEKPFTADQLRAAVGRALADRPAVSHSA